MSQVLKSNEPQASSAAASVSKTHPAWIEINLSHLQKNLAALQKHAGPETEIMAVVKANAYGHGLVPVAKSIAEKVSYLGVSSIAEALTLKELALKTPIFLFGHFPAEELPALLSEEITLTVSNWPEAKEISDLSKALNKTTKVHAKVDTGMGRMGIPYRDAFKQIEKISELPNLQLEGIYTHFPTAEVEDDFALRQLADFCLLIRALERKGITFKYRHAANSAGTVRFQEPLMNMVRPGLMLYGLCSDPSLQEDAGVTPILSLKSRISFVRTLRPGESTGYGRTFVASRVTRIGILPIGYSHGYPWGASGKSDCLIQGKRFPIAGRVSMDYLAVNLGDEWIGEGEEVTLIGERGNELIRAEDLASWANTIPYEIVTQLNPQLPRIYHAS